MSEKTESCDAEAAGVARSSSRTRCSMSGCVAGVEGRVDEPTSDRNALPFFAHRQVRLLFFPPAQRLRGFRTDADELYLNYQNEMSSTSDKLLSVIQN